MDADYRQFGNAIADHLLKRVDDLNLLMETEKRRVESFAFNRNDSALIRRTKEKNRDQTIDVMFIVAIRMQDYYDNPAVVKHFRGKSWEEFWLQISIEGGGAAVMDLSDPTRADGNEVTNPPGHLFGVVVLEPWPPNLEYSGVTDEPRDTFTMFSNGSVIPS